MVDLTVKYAGVEIPSPVWVASQTPTGKIDRWSGEEFARYMENYAKMGAGVINYTPLG